MHDVRVQEVGEFLDGALDEHSKVDVEVRNIDFQCSDVPTDCLNLLHEESLCKVGRAHWGAQELETRSEFGGSGGGGGGIFCDGVGGNSGLNV